MLAGKRVYSDLDGIVNVLMDTGSQDLWREHACAVHAEWGQASFSSDQLYGSCIEFTKVGRRELYILD